MYNYEDKSVVILFGFIHFKCVCYMYNIFKLTDIECPEQTESCRDKMSDWLVLSTLHYLKINFSRSLQIFPEFSKLFTPEI